MRIILIILTLIMPFIATSTHAQEPAEAAEVSVSTTVPSKVSKAQSAVETNTQSTLADPASHSILLTIVLKDADGKPLPDILVIVTSNRGQVDIIEAVGKLGPGYAQAAEISDMQKDKTDKDGMVQFRITSFIPGEAILTILADSLVTLDPIRITFEPLPYPTNVTITVNNPFTHKEINIYTPQTQIDQGLSATQLEAKRLVNTGTKIELNFWYVAVPVVLILLCPILIFLNFLSLRKMRRMEQEQILLLKKMFPPNYNRQS